MVIKLTMSFKKIARSIFFVLILFLNNWGFSQDLEIGIWTGIGSYQMGDLKQMQTQLIQEINIDGLQKTESFPVFYNFGLNYEYSNFGVFFRYESTGARIAYSDFSGSYFYDQTGDNLVLGGSGRFFIENNSTDGLSPFILVKGGVSLSRIEFKETITLSGNSSSNNLNLNETSYFLEPGLGLRLNFKSIIIDPTVSIFLPIIQSGLHLEGNSDAKLQNEDGDIHANWFGIRAGLNFSIAI